MVGHGLEHLHKYMHHHTTTACFSACCKAKHRASHSEHASCRSRIMSKQWQNFETSLSNVCWYPHCLRHCFRLPTNIFIALFKRVYTGMNAQHMRMHASVHSRTSRMLLSAANGRYEYCLLYTSVQPCTSSSCTAAWHLNLASRLAPAPCVFQRW